MKTFDILDRSAPLFDEKLLEASAGTGKTFAIEHLFVRHLLEAPEGEEPLQIDQILAITFTRAATREMRLRIRTAIQAALDGVTGKGIVWPYLESHACSSSARKRLENALVCFDKAPIYTIHGFCQTMLSEFSLEARMMPPMQESSPFKKTLLPFLLEFLETQTALSPSQLGKLIKQRRNPEALCEALLDASCPPEARTYEEDCSAFKRALQDLRFTLQELEREYETVFSSCKTTGFSLTGFEEQMEGFVKSSLEPFILSKDLLLHFVSQSNRKGNKVITTPFFDLLGDRLLPILEEAINPKILFERLRFAWEPSYKELLEDKDLFSPDLLLQRMERAIEEAPFRTAVQHKFRAAIIDEFQDTDRLQWKVFEQLFLQGNRRSLTLVGDPKQSIYRFRKADLYTYFQAKEKLGKDAHYSLDTNYRSTPALISALNDLLGEEKSKPWLWLPKEGRAESYRPVRPGKQEANWDIGDRKGAVHFFSEELNFADEILRLRPYVSGFGSFAILVKDRYQGLEVQSILQRRSIPCWTKSQAPLGESIAAAALHELFESLFDPRDGSRLKILMAGPLMAMQEKLFEELLFMPELYEWKALLEQEGIASFFRTFLSGRTERIREQGSSFYRDLYQIVEQLLEIQTFSYETVRRFFRELKCADVEDTPDARRRVENDEEAVHILTMHASKGLEFDVVFALGVAAKAHKPEEEPEEIEAEKLRQLYVALTRAKLRLYIPLPLKKQRSGSESPLEQFFWRSKLGQDPLAIVAKLSEENPHITFELQKAPLNEPPYNTASKSLPLTPPPPVPAPFWHKRSLLSFTALAKVKEAKIPENELFLKIEESIDVPNLHNMPRGAETGVLLHTIFEKILNEERELHSIVEETIRFSQLKPWQEVIIDLVRRALQTPLVEGLTLASLPKKQRRAEIEFLFPSDLHLVKGFIDLVFEWRSKIYLLDWKTNWLGCDDSYYLEQTLKEAMDEGSYWLQASLYKEALVSAWPNSEFGGAIYFFVRGVLSDNHGVLFFKPQPLKELWK